MFTNILQKIRTIFNHPSYWRAIIACKYGEPLHYHHDGCPACDLPQAIITPFGKLTQAKYPST